MSTGYWHVIQNEEGTRYACQRYAAFYYESGLETTAWLDNENAAYQLCDELNEVAEAEIKDFEESLPDHLR